MICFNILGEIIEAATDSSETVDQVCDSIVVILNLDVISLYSPGTYNDPIFHESPMEVELEERDELLLLDSPAPFPPSAPAHSPASDTLQPFGATDIRTMTEEERVARKRAKKALKKKRSKDEEAEESARAPARPRLVRGC